MMRPFTRALGAFSLVGILATTVDAQQKTVVFVCEHGTVKSLIAIEHFNKLARERGLSIQAISRGTRPDSVVPGPVARGLAADGFDVSLFRPRGLSVSDLASALLVVSFDADVQSVVAGSRPVSRWDSLPSVTANYAAGRSAIVSRIRLLVDSLATVSKRAP
jgi:arsenate reductase (thioredoxin)